MTPEEELQLAEAEAEAAAAAENEPPPATEAAPVSAPGKAETALLGFGRGASMGALPALEGAAKAAAAGVIRAGTPLVRPISRMLAPGVPDEQLDATAREAGTEVLGVDPFQPMGDVYAQARDQSKARLDAATKANPKTMLASTILGGAALPLPGPKGLTTAGRALQRAAQGGVTGGVIGANESRANLVGESPTAADGTRPSFVADTLKGAAGGAVAAPVLGGALSYLGTKGAEALRRASQSNAIRSIVNAGITDKLRRAGIETPAERAQFGQDLLSSGSVRFGDTPAKTLGRIESGADDLERQVEEIISKADLAPRGPDFTRASREAFKALTSGGLTKEAQAQAGGALDMVRKIAAQGKQGPPPLPGATDTLPDMAPSFSTMNQLKRDLYARLYGKADSSLQGRLERQTASGLRKAIEDQVEEAVGVGAGSALRNTNAKLGTLLKARDLATDAASRGDARLSPTQSILSATSSLAPMLGLTTGALTSGGAGAFGGGLAGTAAGAALKTILPRVPSSMAAMQSRAAPVLQSLTPGASRFASQAVAQQAGAQFTEAEQKAVDDFLTKGQ